MDDTDDGKCDICSRYDELTVEVDGVLYCNRYKCDQALSRYLNDFMRKYQAAPSGVIK